MDEALMAAAELIEDHWVRGQGADGKGNYCTLGAFGMVLSNGSYSEGTRGWEWERGMVKLRAVIPECDCDEQMCPQKYLAAVPHWNDRHCTSGVEAAKLLREAAEVELP
jgi:hypothetical protein